MDIQYDENLSDNKFFKKLQTDHQIFLDTAPVEGWIICVPRSGTITEECLIDQEFFLAHILIPNDELPETHFTNMNCKNIQMDERKLILEHVESRILFEEIFYTKDYLKYKIWCIEKPLHKIQKQCINDAEESGELFAIKNVQDAISLINSESRSKTLLHKMDSAVNNFIKNNSDFNTVNLEKLKNNTLLLYNHCLDILLLNRKLKDKCRTDSFLLKSLRISVETYIMNVLYGHLKDAINVCHLERCENFNKIIRNLSDLHISELNLLANYNEMIPTIKHELIKIDDCRTAIDKINCLKKALNIASKIDQSKKSKIITIDDLIPLLIFVIIKSGLTQWVMNLIFLKEFHFNDLSNNNNNEFGQESFLVTTLEAAILYIESGEIKRNHRYSIGRDTVDIGERRTKFTSAESFLGYFFKMILENEENEILNLFNGNDSNNNDITTDKEDLCHPLCDCLRCRNNVGDYRPNINEKNQNGISALHLAAMYGLPKMLTLILSLKPDVNNVDENNWTALHYAAANGHQNLLLLLLHSGIHINSRTDDNHTSLHVACLNGHSGCAKALLYFAEHMRIDVDINAQNNLGNTALHYAAKWCFIDIVDTLLEYAAKVNIVNKAGITPIKSSHNIRISNLLNEALALEPKGQTNIAPILNSNFVYITDEDLYDDLGIFEHKSIEEMNKIDKLLASIVVGDVKLACFYLGIDSNIPAFVNNNEIELEAICHPLCSCQKCLQNSANFYNLMTRKYFDKKLNINACNKDGFTALHVAAIHGHIDLIKIFIEHKAKTSIKTKSGATALHLACKHKKLNSTKVLLNFSANDIVDLKDNNGDTALHYATKLNNYKLVQLLLNEHANPTLRNLNGLRPVDIAKSNLFLSITKLLENF